MSSGVRAGMKENRIRIKTKNNIKLNIRKASMINSTLSNYGTTA